MKRFTPVLGLLTLFVSTFALSACTAETKEDIGIQLWSVRTDMKENPKATIEALGAMGYDFVETAGYANGKFYDMEPEAFKQLVEDNGMKFLGSHCNQHLADSVDWNTLMPFWDECIAAHKSVGAEYIVVPSMSKYAYSSLEGLKKHCDYFNAIGEKCNEAGIRFGYHNHAGEFKKLEGEIIYDFMLKNTDPEKVMFQIDLYWINKGKADAEAYFDKHPGRFESFHIKDNMELGESGNMDFPVLLELRTKAGAKYHVVEVEKYNFTPLESVKKSLEYLQEIGFSD